jgi:hypothetical protein
MVERPAFRNHGTGPPHQRAKRDVVGTTLPLDASLAYSDDPWARIGHHNDCFLAGGTDYGTYVER